MSIKRRIVSAVVLVFLSAAIAAGVKVRKVVAGRAEERRVVRNARIAITRDEVRRAAGEVARLLRDKPDDVDLNLAAAWLAMRTGTNAGAAFDQAARAVEKAGTEQTDIGIYLWHSRLSEEILGHSKLGVELLSKKRYEQAEAELTKGVAKSLTTAQWLRRLRIRRTAESWTYVAAMDASKIAWTKWKRGQLRSIDEVVRDASARLPSDSAAAFAKRIEEAMAMLIANDAYAAASRRDYPQAQRLLELAVARWPAGDRDYKSFHELRYFLAGIYDELRQPSRALAILDELEKAGYLQEPKQLEFRERVRSNIDVLAAQQAELAGYEAVKKGDLKTAARHFSHSAEIVSRLKHIPPAAAGELWMRAAVALTELGDYEGARSAIIRSIATGKEPPEARDLLRQLESALASISK